MVPLGLKSEFEVQHVEAIEIEKQRIHVMWQQMEMVTLDC